MHKIRTPAEIGVLLTLLRGCDFDGLAPHQIVTVDNGKTKSALDKAPQQQLVVGFVDRDWRYGSFSDLEKQRVTQEETTNNKYLVTINASDPSLGLLSTSLPKHLKIAQEGLGIDLNKHYQLTSESIAKIFTAIKLCDEKVG